MAPPLLGNKSMKLFRQIWTFSPLRIAFQTSRQFQTSTMLPKELMVKGKLLNYEIVGQGEKIVLCLPGALGTIRSDFGPQLEGLSHKKFKLVAWDPPGYGKSRPPPRNYTLDFLDRDAAMAGSMMKTLGFNKYSLLGWSDGGITALMMAAAFPDHIEKAVIWGSNAYIHEGDLELYAKVRDINKWSARMRAPLEAAYGKEYFKAAWEGWVDALTAIYHQKGGDLCKSGLAKIVCPTLIIHGVKDPIVGIEHAEYIRDNVANSQLIVMEEGKHNLHMRYAEEFNAMVNDFLLKDE